MSKKPLPPEISISGGPAKMTLGELLGKAEKISETEGKNKTPAPKEEDGKIPSRFILRRETAGRGGKVVTLVIFPKEVRLDLEALAKRLKKGLGCGAYTEDGKIVLQGDIADRAGKLLEKLRGENRR